MSGFWDDVRDVVATVAPTVATALGGPLAGMAVGQLSEALLGRRDATEAEIRDAIRMATPDDLLKLRTLEQDFRLKMQEAGVKLERIAADDRDSARRRQIETGDATPSLLGVCIVAGFFGVLTLVIFYDLPEGGGDVFKILLGSLGAMTVQVGNYFFGSSAGSAAKNRMITEMKGRARDG